MYTVLNDRYPGEPNSQQKTLTEKIAALRAEVVRLEGVRDSAVSQATNPEDAERARAALQEDVNRVRERLEQAESE